VTAVQFDSLKYARRLRDVGVPEPQADTQAELMAEAFGFYVDNLVTKEHLDLALDKRFAQQDARIDARFAQQGRTLAVHTWMLGVIVLTVLVPTLERLSLIGSP
jgi:hypothetical protein